MNRPQRLLDLHPPAADIRSEVCAGLAMNPKRIASKFFYDAGGSALFEAICEQPEYYLTRTELGILQQRIGDIAATLGEQVLLLEFGSGSGVKTACLLRGLVDPVAYVPIDISREALAGSTEALSRALPGLPLLPVCADFTGNLPLPAPPRPPRRKVMFFPGSTLGNFAPAEAIGLLRQMRALVGNGGALLLGLDMKKDPARLEAAYNDAAGITTAFTLNLLRRLNREIGADFDLDGFQHRARYHVLAGRIETHLVSRRPQQVRIGNRCFDFAADEAVLVEYSTKYAQSDVERLAAQAGFVIDQVFADAAGDFTLQLLRAV